MVTGSSAGHAIVRQLAAEGVQRVYAVPGESYLDVLDGLHEAPVRTIVCRQEGGAAFMAVADSRLTRGLGVCAVTRGPGAANAAIGVHTAYQDATPFLLLVGLIPVADRHRESFQEFDLAGWFGTTAKAVWTLDDPRRAAEMVRDAAHLARSGRPGPVVLGLPEDVLVQPTGSGSRGPLPSRAAPAGAVDPGDLAQVRDWLDRAQRPLVLLGGDTLTPGGAADLRDWVEAWELPVVTDFRTQDQLDHDSPSWCGWLGFGRCEAAARLLDEADLLFVVGDAVRDVLSDGFALGSSGRRTILVSLDPEALAHAGGIDLQVLASPDRWAATCSATRPTKGRFPWAERTRTAHAEFTAWATPGADEPDSGVDLAAAMAHVRSCLDPDAIITYGAGNHAIWAQRYLPCHAFPTLLAPRNGAMGFGVPAAVAASLIHPGRQVVSVAGDGCFLMNGQELATATAYGGSPVVLVVDNGQFGTIRAHQEREYPGRVSGTQLVNPDFGAYGRAFGGFGARVETTADFAEAFDAALAHPGLAVVHLRVDPAVLAPR